MPPTISHTAACQAACTLLTMAEDLGLTHLRSVALDFIVHNFAAVSATEAYGHLSKEHMHQVAMEAAASYSRVQQLVRSMSDKVCFAVVASAHV